MKHIIIAEDEKHTRRAVSIILKKAGYKVSVADDGRVALDLIVSCCDNDEPLSMLIFDIEMPGMTGFELLDELKNLHLDIPTLAMSGYGDGPTFDKLKKSGCNNLIPKPFDRNQLLEKIEEILGT